MAIVHSSSFDGSENPISESGDWSAGTGNFGTTKKDSGVLKAAAGITTKCNCVSTKTYPDDQYCQYVVGVAGYGSYSGAVLRGNTSDGDCYLWHVSHPTYERIYRVEDNGGLSYNQLGSALSGRWITGGEVMRGEVVGSDIEGFEDGGSKMTRTDAAYSSGKAGLVARDNTDLDDTTLDTFEAGDFITPITVELADNVNA